MGGPGKQVDGLDVLAYEKAAWSMGFKKIAGVDEVGRGALCGPVVAAAVILKNQQLLNGVKDSKKLTPEQRSRIFRTIYKKEIIAGIGVSRAGEVDRINVLEATRTAMARAIKKLRQQPDYLLLDAILLPKITVKQESIIKGDMYSHSIAAASIVAKVVRDRIMDTWNRRFPGYGFDRNKGYGTAGHLDALKRLGPCGIHRRTFKGVYDCRGLFD